MILKGKFIRGRGFYASPRGSSLQSWRKGPKNTAGAYRKMWGEDGNGTRPIKLIPC